MLRLRAYHTVVFSAQHDNYSFLSDYVLNLTRMPEGAIQIIDYKARLVSDLMCDSLDACLGHCRK